MVRKILKWTGIFIGSLLVLAGIFLAIVYVSTNKSRNKVYAVKLQPLTIPTDSAAYNLGKHVAETRGCFGCHGNDLAGGRAFADANSPIGILYAANLTPGKGGIHYRDSDWVKALRHGLGQNNKSLWFMPSHEICQISNQDLASLISYVKAQPAVDKTNPEKELKPLGRLLTFLGKFPMFVAEKIDHNASYKDVVSTEVSPAYGKYLAVTCQGCHGANFKGNPAHSAEEPNIPDITTTSEVGTWKESDLVTVFKTGNTPTRQLKDAMPWKEFHYSDTEVKAIYAYLQTLK